MVSGVWSLPCPRRLHTGGTVGAALAELEDLGSRALGAADRLAPLLASRSR